MKVSLVCPLRNEAARVDSLLSDIQSFFQKFPIEVELVLVVDPSNDGSVEKIAAHLDKNQSRFEIRLFTNEFRQGRGPSLLVGLNAAEGDLLFPMAADLNVPLSEYFSGIQEFVLQPDLDLLLGHGPQQGRKKRQGQKNRRVRWGQKLLLSRLPPELLKSCDPLSPFWGIRRTCFQRLKIQALPSWFFTPAIAALALRENLAHQQMDVLIRDDHRSQFSLLREALPILHMQL